MSIDELEQLATEAYALADASRAEELRRTAYCLETAVDGRSHAVVGGALLVAYKLDQRLDDLEAAIVHLEAACALDPKASRLSNLGSALLERLGLPSRGDAEGDREDYQRAVEALEDALRATPDDQPEWMTRAIVLLGARITAVDLGLPEADLSEALQFGERVVAIARREKVGAGEAENLLGGALLAAAMLGDSRGDLRRAGGLLEESIALLPESHPDRPARLSNLGAVLLDSFEQSGGFDSLIGALDRNRQAFASAAPHDRRRPLIANNLLNALVAGFRYTGRRQLVDEARALFDVLEDAFRAGDALYPVVRSNLGNALHAAFVLDGRSEDLDAAIERHEEAIAASLASDAFGPSRHAALAVALAARYRITDRPEHLHDALVHGRLALAAERVAAHELARHKSDLGNLAHDAYLRTGSIPQLETAATLHREGLAALPLGNPTTPGLLNNAAITLSDRFDRLGDPDDLLMAISALERANGITPHDHPDASARTANLATNYHRRFGITGELRDLDLAEELAQRVRGTSSDADVIAAAFSVEVSVAAERWNMSPTSGGRAQLRALERVANGLTRRPGTAAQHLFRRAYIKGLLGEPRDDLLRQAAQAGLETRPAVALEAGRQLAIGSLRRQAAGSASAQADVQEGLNLAAQALAHLAASSGMPATYSPGDATRQGWPQLPRIPTCLQVMPTPQRRRSKSAHAALLQGRLDLTVASPPPSESVIQVWSTDVGGGAVLHSRGASNVVALPELALTDVRKIVHRANVAAHLGTHALKPVLEQASERIGAALEPLLQQLAPGESVTWCAGGLVAMLPIGIARSPNGRRVLENHDLTHAPTYRLAQWSRSVAATRRLDMRNAWSLAAPAPSVHSALEAATTEAKHFAHPERCYTSHHATHERALKALTNGSLVHFACHARTTTHDPLASHLLLAGDTPLFAEELLEIRSPARAVVLAACDTGTVRGTFADEALGLASALHVAGVPSVVASLWTVPDLQTSELMSSFADRLNSGESLRKALRRAALEALPSSLAAAAAFVVIGA